MNIIGNFHEKHVFQRRVEVLASQLGKLMPTRGKILDVGCGNGLIDNVLQTQNPGLELEGIDVLVRPDNYIHVEPFDGETIPHPDNSFDTVMFIDVLHHTEDPLVLLREAKRVARQHIVMKDHFRDGFMAGPTLRFMDWVGNAHHGVVLPYNYWSQKQWQNAFNTLQLQIIQQESQLNLYPPPASWVFDRGLHFVAKLAV